MYRNILHSCIAVVVFVTTCTGQSFPENRFALYTTADGLSDNSVNGIVQDRTGYIWLPTSSGLNRFDGTRFVQYHSTQDSLSPASEEMNGINWLDKDRFAVYSTGLHIVNVKTGETRNLFIPYSDRQYAYKFNMIISAMGDEGGNIYVLTRSGFYHFDSTGRLLSRFDYYSPEQIPTEHFFFGRELLRMDNHRLLITSINGLYYYDIPAKRVKKMEVADCPVLAEFVNEKIQYSRFFQHSPNSIIITRTGTDTICFINFAENRKVISRSPFIMTGDLIHYRSKLVRVDDTLFYLTGHNSGFYRMRVDPHTGKINLYTQKYLGAWLCNDLLIDRDKNLWVATNKGLYRQDDTRSRVQVTYIPGDVEAAIPTIRIAAVFATAEKVYAGTRGFGGMLVYDKKTFRFEKHLPFPNEEKGRSIYKISSTGPHRLLLGTGGSLRLFDEITGKETRLNPPLWSETSWTSDLFTDRKGGIWISAEHIYRYEPATNRFTVIPAAHSMPVIPVAFAEDTSGHIWVAGHGIIRYNSALSAFDIKLDSFPYIKMPDKQVTAMIIDGRNNIWFGIANNGLICYNIDRKMFRHFTRASGLPDDNISALSVVGDKLWIACYTGVACMHIASSAFRRFGKEEGFPDIPVQKNAKFFFDSAQQQLYIGFYNAVARFNPGELLSESSRPSVFIENLAFGGGRNIYLPGGRVSTSWRNNDIMISIGSINFPDGQGQGYAYRVVKNGESPWQQLGSQHVFSMSNLLPGVYRVQVKIYSLKNRWPEQVREIVIEVLPPFWQKTWFRILMTLLLFVLINSFIQWRTGIARKKEMEKTQVEKLKADDYKNKLELEQISHYFSSSLADKKSEDEVLWDVARNLIGRMNYTDCMIYLWDAGKTKMVQKAAFGLKGRPEIISEQVFDVLPGQGVVGHVIQTQQPLLIRDTRKDSRYRVDEAFRLSEVCVPIIHNNELLGVIDSEHAEAGYFSERDINMLTTIATLLGNKLKQLESEQSLAVKQKELTSINEQLAEAKLSALQAQMNPHFVFNALNSIKRMILDGDNDKASRYLSKFALMIRMTLEHSKEAFDTLQENIDYLQTYLEMEQLRFDGSFSWTITVAESIDPDDTHIPSLMIQPLVENAIWHGLMPSAGEKRLTVAFTRDGDQITCIIEDNGIGIRQSEKLKAAARTGHRSVGLENLRNRINILNEKYGAACSLVISDVQEITGSGNGTRAILRFNMINL